jgi:hypothetical protein
MDELRTTVSNVPEYTVSEISGAVKRTLEGNFGRVRVRGEITELKRYPSGHIYFSLKDEGAKIAGVVWKSTVSRLGMVPENGVEVIATGRISPMRTVRRISSSPSGWSMPGPAPCSPASRCCACAWWRRDCSTPTASVGCRCCRR